MFTEEELLKYYENNKNAKKYNLNQGNLNNHINGKSKSISGWKIEKIPELE